jgi:hypothetical protein
MRQGSIRSQRSLVVRGFAAGAVDFERGLPPPWWCFFERRPTETSECDAPTWTHEIASAVVGRGGEAAPHEKIASARSKVSVKTAAIFAGCVAFASACTSVASTPRFRSPDGFVDYVCQRTALVLALPQVVAIETDEVSSIPELHPTSEGTAAAVTTDGYWITAAHCCWSDSGAIPHLLWWDDVDGNAPVTVHVLPARVVWCGRCPRDDQPDSDADLALVCAGRGPQLGFDTVDASALCVGTRVAQAGFGHLAAIGFQQPRERLDQATFWGEGSFAIDAVRPVRNRPGGAVAGEVVLRGAGIPGNSGGPIVTQSGRLLAITSRRAGNGELVAVAPSWEWIRTLIREDRVLKTR